MKYRKCQIKGRAISQQLLDLSERSRRKSIEIGAAMCKRRDGKSYLSEFCEGESCQVDVCAECPSGHKFLGDVHTHPRNRWPVMSSVDINSVARCKAPTSCVIAADTGLMACFDKKNLKLAQKIGRHRDYADTKWSMETIQEIGEKRRLNDFEEAEDIFVEQYNAHGDKFGLRRDLNEYLWKDLMDWDADLWRKVFCLTRLGE